MSKSIFSIALIVLLLTPVLVSRGAESCAAATTGEPLRLGTVFPQGALFAAQNRVFYEAAATMLQVVNDCGGVAGRPLEWVHEAATSRTQAVSAVNRLVEAGVPLIVGSGSLAVSQGAREAAEAAAVVYWEVSESLDFTGEWVFSPRPSNHQLGAAAVQFVTGTLPDALALTEMRLALVYEDRPRGQAAAQGIRDTLSFPPIIDYAYSDNLDEATALAVQLRDQKIDVLLLAAFDFDSTYLWYAARQADANLDAWVHIGGQGYRRSLCQQLGNFDGFISIDAAGPVSLSYRQTMEGSLYDRYRRAYLAEYNRESGQLADLTASGVDLLLRHVLPAVQGDFTPENIRAAMMSLDVPPLSGMMGEGLVFEGGLNQAPAVIIQQQQSGQSCSLLPSGIATCTSSLMSFPTWRERIVKTDAATCGPML